MTIEIVNGLKKEVWYILYHGYGWYETYGPSMTDMASYYNIDRLLKIEGNREIKLIENTLPQEIGSLYQLMKLILRRLKWKEFRILKMSDWHIPLIKFL